MAIGRRSAPSSTKATVDDRHRYWDHLKPLLLGAKMIGTLVHDTRVAAICRSAGVREIWTADRDYSSGLPVHNPLHNPLIMLRAYRAPAAFAIASTLTPVITCPRHFRICAAGSTCAR